MNVLDLFSGIGGFSLGLERAGMRTVAFCEVNDYCRRVLAKHWPDAPILGDVTEAEFPAADVVTAGFPCQDISYAGEGAGLAGARSGLYRHVIRAIRLVRPRFAVLENVAALLTRGLDTVCGDLAEIGYDAEWHCIPAAAVGAPHRRDRIWIIADPGGEQHESRRPPLSGAISEELSRTAANAYGDGEHALAFDAEASGAPEHAPDAYGELIREQQVRQRRSGSPAIAGAIGEDPDATSLFGTSFLRGEPDGDYARPREMADAGSSRLQGPGNVGGEAGSRPQAGQPLFSSPSDGRQWIAEPDVGRVAHGVPSRVDRLRSLGNSVVPQIPEIIGRAIMARSNTLTTKVKHDGHT